jgi:hypothetical protein
MNNNQNNKRSNGEIIQKSKSIPHASQSTTNRHRRNSLPIPPNPSDVKAKQARGTLKTCLESMSNFLHQKLNEQTSVQLTIQSPNEEPLPPQGASSPSFLNDQEQEILNTNRQRQTSLDERIRSIFNHNPDDEKTDHEIKELPKTNLRKSLPMPPGTSKSNEEHKQTASRKRSSSFGGKSTSRKLSSSSMKNKRLSATTTSSTHRKSSTKKSRDSKVNCFHTIELKNFENVIFLASCEYQNNFRSCR